MLLINEELTHDWHHFVSYFMPRYRWKADLPRHGWASGENHTETGFLLVCAYVVAPPPPPPKAAISNSGDKFTMKVSGRDTSGERARPHHGARQKKIAFPFADGENVSELSERKWWKVISGGEI